MRQRLLLMAAAGAPAVGLGCGAPGATGPGAPARLSLAVVPAGVEGAPGGAVGSRLARLTLRHEGGRAVALSGCPRAPSVRVERREAGVAWREIGSYGLRCQAIYSTSTVALAVGGQIEAVIAVGPAGQYRFAVPVGPDAGAPEFEVRSAAVDLP
jgi:hypothetical protein